jgi:hypothetical protein
MNYIYFQLDAYKFVTATDTLSSIFMAGFRLDANWNKKRRHFLPVITIKY